MGIQGGMVEGSMERVQFMVLLSVVWRGVSSWYFFPWYGEGSVHGTSFRGMERGQFMVLLSMVWRGASSWYFFPWYGEGPVHGTSFCGMERGQFMVLISMVSPKQLLLQFSGSHCA
jgi:hypothetical protein